MNDIEKSRQLGMPYGTATGKLRKLILFHLLKKHNENVCFQCGKEIETVDELSMEHKKPWLHESSDLFWDVENIAFSHLHCNLSTTRPPLHPRPKIKVLIHGTTACYRHSNCRCKLCKKSNAEKSRLYRRRTQ